MNSTGRPRMPLALLSLANSSPARRAWMPYWALLPESAAGMPILIGVWAYTLLRNTGPPTPAAAPPTAAIVRNSRRLMLDPPCLLRLFSERAPRTGATPPEYSREPTPDGIRRRKGLTDVLAPRYNHSHAVHG